MKDPCQHARNTTIVGHRSKSQGMSSCRRSRHSLGSLMLRIAAESCRTEAGSAPCKGDGHGGTSQDGSSANRKTVPKKLPAAATAAASLPQHVMRKEPGTVPETRSPIGLEALPAPEERHPVSSIKVPDGVCRKNGGRGCLVGLYPEGVCMEARNVSQ